MVFYEQQIALAMLAQLSVTTPLSLSNGRDPCAVGMEVPEWTPNTTAS
jgi:hypothetical protein